MNVAKLREMLEGVDDDLIVVLEGGDHTYYQAGSVGEAHAEKDKHNTLYMWYGDEHMEEGSEKVKVFYVAG